MNRYRNFPWKKYSWEGIFLWIEIFLKEIYLVWEVDFYFANKSKTKYVHLIISSYLVDIYKNPSTDNEFSLEDIFLRNWDLLEAITPKLNLSWRNLMELLSFYICQTEPKTEILYVVLLSYLVNIHKNQILAPWKLQSCQTFIPSPLYASVFFASHSATRLRRQL